MVHPLSTVEAIGEKLIRETPFRLRLETAPVRQSLENVTVEGMQSLDFGRTLGLGRPGIAYAMTLLTALEPTTLELQIEHSDGCKVWLNGALVYHKSGPRSAQIHFDERSVEMRHGFSVNLQAGSNHLLIKSETRGSEWVVYLQTPSRKGAVEMNPRPQPQIGLAGMKDVDQRVAALSNWLIIGPFGNESIDSQYSGIDQVFAPEREIRFGRMYQGRDEAVTWTIPRLEVLGALIDPRPWGTNDQWNYHNGGVAWAMQQLTEVSGKAAFARYARTFCDYHLEGMDFVRYQVRTLHAIRSANHFLIDSPLLDFTLAPSLPFIHRLRHEKEFTNRGAYEQFIDRMLNYAQHEQIRLPGENIYTRTTPVQYTTWVDDMFMGIPFLLQAAMYQEDPALRQEYFDDAAHQTLAFNKQVWDTDAQLYMHAHYSTSSVKLPHWSRCNGWAIWTMSEVLTHLPPTHRHYPEILAQFRRHVDSLLRFQQPDGFWLNVLDRPDSQPEVSGTAIFVMAISRGLRHGWLAADAYGKAAQLGWQAVASQVDPDGSVHRICVGTMCSEDPNYYVNRPMYDDDTHGTFAVIFAGIEFHRWITAAAAV